jgi:hypothetical protein
MTLDLTQPPTEMSTGNLPGSKALPALKTDKFTVIGQPIV